MTSSFLLKPWPVCIFEDFPFSLYIVAASESDEGLVYLNKCHSINWNVIFIKKVWIQIRLYIGLNSGYKLDPMQVWYEIQLGFT